MRKFTLLIALMALCVSSWATVTQQQIGSFYYELDDETHTATLIKNPNASDEWTSYDVYSDLVISATVNDGVADYTVTTIGEKAFQNGGMPSLVIEEGVVNIANNAFWACSNLKKATLPSSIESIGDYAFQYSGLTKITINATTPPTLGYYVFENASSLAHIYVPSADVSAYKGASGWSDHASIIEAAPITVEWNQAKVATVNVWASSGSEPESQTIDGITVTATAPLSGDYSQFSTYVDDVYHTSNTSISINNTGTITFAPTSGKLKSIVIDCGYHENSNLLVEGSGWSWNGGEYSGQLIWTSPIAEGASSVVLACSGASFYFSSISSIEFVFAAEEAAPVDPTPAATTITWNTADLATINVEMGYNSTGQSQYIKDIIVTNSAVYTAGQYCHFNTANGQYNGEDWPDFSISDGGSLTFAPAEGKLTKIVITCDDIYPSNLAAGSGWVWDGSSKLTWSDENGATSVVLAGDGSSTSFSSGPIRLIEFTVVTESATADPNSVTWNALMLQAVNLYQSSGNSDGSTSVEMRGVTASVWAVEGGNYAHFKTTSDNVNISVSNGGTLTFSSATKEFTSIVINTNNGEGYGGSDGWVWDSEEATLTWTGEATNSVELANSYVTQITSIVFTFATDEPVEPDTREVPELKFYDNLTEATIIHDMFGWDFEPGTTYNPRYGYTISVKDGVYYYQGQPYDYWKAPSELEESLPITYSLSNNDVIELTQTEGDEFRFNVLDRGDVVVTASTVGNTRFQPASITFTIHVIDGQAPTKECVLKWVSGPDAGQLVPADFEFNLQTGDEVEWESMQLYEKDYPAYVYAPSTAIWGSRDYHVASLNGELKLRALMAGDDVFTVQYSRYPYPTGFINGNFRTIEIPVHIKPSQPALVSDVDFSSSPLEDPNVLFNTSNYDPVAHEAQLAGTLTTQEVLDVLHTNNYNSQGWKDNLPQTISFELAAGKGSFEVNCSVQPGYEVRIIKGGDTQANDIITSSTPQPYVVSYDVTDQTPVVIFVAVAGSSNPAPKRAPAAKQDAPIASFSALAVTPTYPIAAKADPDNAGVYYSTHFNETQKYQLPVGTEAYVATISGTDMNLTKVADGGQVIPANTALILKSTSASVTLTPTDAAAVTISAPNQLQGTDSEKAAPANCYVLSGHSTDYSVTGVGFYAFSGTLPAHKAYLIYVGGACAPQRMRFIFNSPTDVEWLNSNVRATKVVENGHVIIIKNGVRYNAQGQVVK